MNSKFLIKDRPTLTAMLKASTTENLLAQIEKIADDIEQEMRGRLESEVQSERVGELVMSRLKALDEVAYVRFASVYRSFKDINTFMEELTKLLGDKK